MSVIPDNVDDLLNEIRNTIQENRKFLRNLEDENDDPDDPDTVADSQLPNDEDDFEEL
jgi:hypothetical protein